MNPKTTFILNPYKDTGLDSNLRLIKGKIRTNPEVALALFKLCPAAHETPMLKSCELARELGIANIYIKDERQRMGLGSFKALGAAFAIAKMASEAMKNKLDTNFEEALLDTTFVCASAGNHGLSMAAGARIFGAVAIVFLSHTVPEDFAERLRLKGAKVIRQGHNYEASMKAAINAAEKNNWHLLSDRSWPGCTEAALDIMEGYLIMGAEAATQLQYAPTHIFIQAGVGGLAAALTAATRNYWGPRPKICVVEPEYAPALMGSILSKSIKVADGPISNMGRLDCKEPSLLALKYLAEEADAFMTVSDEEAIAAAETLEKFGIATSTSGAAGLAGLIQALSTQAQFFYKANNYPLICVSENKI